MNRISSVVLKDRSVASFREFHVLVLAVNVHSRDTLKYIIDVRKTMLIVFVVFIPYGNWV